MAYSSLTVYGTNSTTSTLSTANKLVTSTGGGSTFTTTKVGTSTGWGELYSQGNTSVWAAGGAIGSPSGHGFLWDVTTLEGQTILAGNWTPVVQLLTSIGSITADIHVRAYKYNGGAYTSIGDMSKTGQSITTGTTTYTFSASSLSAVSFSTGDKLYVDVWLNITANSTGSGSATVFLNMASSSTQGVASEMQVGTPGYATTGTLVLLGSDGADGTLTTACDMSTTADGTETTKTTTTSGTGTWAEITSQGASVSAVASIPATPTGNGWIYYPGSGKFAAGNWSAIINSTQSAGTTASAQFTIRFFKYSGGSYTSIGNITITGQNWSSSKAQYSFGATSMGAVSIGASDGIYVDLWGSWNGGSVSWSSINPVIYESTSASHGVANDVLVNTSAFTAGTQVFKDVTTRGRISATVYKDITTRGKVSATTYKDVTTRGKVSAKVTKDISTRGKVSAQPFKDITVRGRTSATIRKDVTVRARVSTTIYKDVTVRGIISAGIASGGFTLFANGTGTATYDSFRVTQYPDPALSLYNVGRAGSTYVGWDAILPNSNTTLGMDVSIDGFTWSDVSNQNGGTIPGIFAQPDPTIDGFDSNTGMNYTTTYRTGGSVPTVTYDTTNSRLVLTNGTNGLYIYNGINNADIAMIADLDQADAGGLVFDYIDQSDFYLLTIADSAASVGTSNTMTLYKIASNVQTQLATATIAWTRGTWKRFKVQMASGVITAYFDGTQVFTYTDSSPLGAGNMGLYNNGGTVGSRYYQVWMQPLGDYVSGTPFGDIVTAKFVYTRQRLATSNSSYTPQVLDVTTVVYDPKIGAGATIPAISYKGKFISVAYDDAAKQSDYSWYIDDNSELYFRVREVNPSPWILQSSSIVPQSDLEVDSNLYVETSGPLYRNRQIVLGCTDTATFSETHIGDGHATSFTLGYPLAAAPSSFTLNNVTQTLGVKGTTGAQFYYAIGDSVITQDSSVTVLTSSDQIMVTYEGSFPVDITVDNLTAQATLAAVQGGTGIVEAVEDRTGQGLDKAAGTTLANQLLDRYCITGRTIQFLTSRDGLDIGQYLSVFLPEHGLWDDQLLITNVQIQKLQTQPNNTVIYWYLVQASELPNQAGWSKLIGSLLLSQ
jgi:hypothetical protein